MVAAGGPGIIVGGATDGGRRSARLPVRCPNWRTWPVRAQAAIIGPWTGSGAWWRCPGGPARDGPDPARRL